MGIINHWGNVVIAFLIENTPVKSPVCPQTTPFRVIVKGLVPSNSPRQTASEL